MVNDYRLDMKLYEVAWELEGECGRDLRPTQQTRQRPFPRRKDTSIGIAKMIFRDGLA